MIELSQTEWLAVLLVGSALLWLHFTSHGGEDDEFFGVSRRYAIPIAYFLGGAVDAIALDWSDIAAFLGLPGCGANQACIVWYYDWFPFIFEGVFALAAFALAYSKVFKPQDILGVYAFSSVVAAAYAILFIPAGSGLGGFVFLMTVVAGAWIAVGVTAGVVHEEREFE